MGSQTDAPCDRAQVKPWQPRTRSGLPKAYTHPYTRRSEIAEVRAGIRKRWVRQHGLAWPGLCARSERAAQFFLRRLMRPIPAKPSSESVAGSGAEVQCAVVKFLCCEATGFRRWSFTDCALSWPPLRRGQF
jgi:hypothetical protein